MCTFIGNLLLMRHFSSSYELKISLTQYRYALIHNEYVALNFWCDWFNKHHSALWSFYSLTHNNVRVSLFQLFIETSLWWLSNYNLKLSCCALNILCTYVWEVQSIKIKNFPMRGPHCIMKTENNRSLKKWIFWPLHSQHLCTNSMYLFG